MNIEVNILNFLRLLVASTILMAGCSDKVSGKFHYQPIKHVEVNINLTKHESDQTSLLYCDVEYLNNSKELLFLNIGNLKAKVRNTTSSATYYDSLASVMPEKEKLERGKSSYNLYFVFPKKLNGDDLDEFEIVNFGLSPD